VTTGGSTSAAFVVDTWGIEDGSDVTVSFVSGDSVGDTSDEEITGSLSGVSKGVSLTEPCYAKEFKVDLNTIEMFIRARASRLEPYVSTH
jgi:hypothetical protein